MPHFDTFPNNSISYTIDTLVMLIFVLIIITKNRQDCAHSGWYGHRQQRKGINLNVFQPVNG